MREDIQSQIVIAVGLCINVRRSSLIEGKDEVEEKYQWTTERVAGSGTTYTICE